MASNFSPQIIAAVWMKGRTSPDYDARVYRLDAYGNWMRFADYGNRSSTYGWEIDHIIAEANGGGDDLSNLQPLYWNANAIKGDKL